MSAAEEKNETKEAGEAKEIFEDKRLAETREISVKIANALVLAKSHPDWRVQDFLLNYLGVESCNRLSRDWVSLYKARSSTSDCDFPETLSWTYALRRHHSPARLSSFVRLGADKQFFIMDSQTLHLVSYDFSKKQWQRHFFHSNELGLCEPSQQCSERVSKEQAWLKIHAEGQHPIRMQTIKTKEGQEHLFLLARQSDLSLVLWRYEPDARGWQKSRVGPKASWKNDLTEMELCVGRDSLFLLGRRENNLEFWRYVVSEDVWEQLPCDIPGVCFEDGGLGRSPQAMMVEMSPKEERLFVLLLRKTGPLVSNFKFELWSYEPVGRMWTLHPPASLAWKLNNIGDAAPRMQKVEVAGEPVLFFLECNVSATNLWSFNPKTLEWAYHAGGPQWSLVECVHPIHDEGAKHLRFIHLQTLSSYEKGTDILLFFQQSFLRGVACSAYHPAKRQWTTVPIPGLSDLLWDSSHYKTQLHLERIHNEYRLVIFNESSISTESGGPSQREVQCWTYPLNVQALEKRLSAAPQAAIFSELELQRARAFLGKITRVSRALLTSAQAGDWSAVFDSLAQGADIHASDQGRNALQLALQHNPDLSTLQRLLKAGLAVSRPTLELARGQGLVEVYNYLADLLDRPALMVMDVETQFRASYLKHLERAQQFLDKYPSDIQKCEVILNYYRLLSKSNPYAVYAWPGVLLLGETLSLPISTLESRPDLLQRVQTFFIQTLALHRALVKVGREQIELVQNPSDLDWMHVIAAIELKEAAEKLEASSPEEALSLVYGQHHTLLLQGTSASVAGFAQALGLELEHCDEITRWVMAQQQYSPHLFREYYKLRFQAHFKSLAQIARAASEAEIVVLPAKLSLAPMLQSLEEQEEASRATLSKVEQIFLREKAELEQWLDKRQAEYLGCLQEIEALMHANQAMDAKVRAEFEKANREISAQFAQFRQELESNKAQALHKVEKQAFKSLVVMAAGCCVAYTVAPMLASAIGGPTALGLSKSSLAILETVLKGGIIGGVSGGFARQNIAVSTLKGAGLAVVGIGAGKAVGQLFPAADPLLQSALAKGLESGVRASVEKDKPGKNVLATIGTGLLMGEESVEPQGFLQMLSENLRKGFIGGAVHAAVHHQPLSSSVAAAAITASVYTASESLGKGLAARWQSATQQASAREAEQSLPLSSSSSSTSSARQTSTGNQTSTSPQKSASQASTPSKGLKSEMPFLTAYDNYRQQAIGGFAGQAPYLFSGSDSFVADSEIESRGFGETIASKGLNKRLPLYDVRHSYAGASNNLSERASTWYTVGWHHRPQTTRTTLHQLTPAEQFQDLSMKRAVEGEEPHHQNPVVAGLTLGLPVNVLKLCFVDAPVMACEVFSDVERMIEEPAHLAHRKKQIGVLVGKLQEDPSWVARQVGAGISEHFSSRFQSVRQEYEMGNYFSAGFMASELIVEAGGLFSAGKQLFSIAAKSAATGIKLGGRGLAEAAGGIESFNASYRFRSPFLLEKPPTGTVHLYCGGDPFDGIKLQKPWTKRGFGYEKSTANANNIKPKIWTETARVKAAQLPQEGRIRFIPRDDYHPSMPLLKGKNGGYLDKFDNEWVKGSSRTLGEPFEWDIQLSEQGKKQLGWASRDGVHLNVSLKGHVTHK